VQVRVETTDRYGRSVGWVTLPDGTNLNREILLVGMGWWYRKYYPNDRSLEELEEKARAAKYGLWKDKHPVPLLMIALMEPPEIGLMVPLESGR
jgi:endonuclease YncB( thermonuclease family)